jgi:hypothetical protein
MLGRGKNNHPSIGTEGMSFRRWVGTGLGILGFSFCLLLLPCTQKVRNGAGYVHSQENLKNVGLALHDYDEHFGRLPAAVVRDKGGRPLYSWRVVLLPFLEEERLYKQFKLDEPWDSPHNKKLLEKTPKCYLPYIGGNDQPGLTRYQVLVGPGTAFGREGLTLTKDDFPDGLAETILVVEGGEPVPWTKPVDLTYDPDGPLPELGGVWTKPVHFLCYEVKRKPGFNACFADGSARFINSGAEENDLRGLITRNGGEPVKWSRLE